MIGNRIVKIVARAHTSATYIIISTDECEERNKKIIVGRHYPHIQSWSERKAKRDERTQDPNSVPVAGRDGNETHPEGDKNIRRRTRQRISEKYIGHNVQRKLPIWILEGDHEECVAGVVWVAFFIGSMGSPAIFPS